MKRIRTGWLAGALLMVLGTAVIAGPAMFDVSNLANGESRDFFAGDKHMTATRSGDEVTISRVDSDEMNDIVCQLATDTCKIGVSGEHIMLSISKERNCTGADCDAGDIDVLMHHPGANVMIEKIIDCDGDDCPELANAHVILNAIGANCEGDDCPEFEINVDCEGDDCGEWVSADGNVHTFSTGNVMMFKSDCEGEECEELELHGLAGGALNSFVVDVDGMPNAENMFVIRAPGQQLQWKGADDIDGCPEGFRTMRFTDESSEDGYLCVKQSENGVQTMRPRVRMLKGSAHSREH